MSFVVRIFFIGLIAFVPSRDGKELAVLLLDAREGYAVSDGTRIEPHQPLLLARAGKCEGGCESDAGIAPMLFPKAAAAPADQALALAVEGGTAWRLDGVDLSILAGPHGRGRSSPLKIHREATRADAGQRGLVPGTPAEWKDFRWVADLGRIDPSAGTVDPDVLAAAPQKGLIAARLRLGAGEVSTYRLVRVEDAVPALDFKTLRGGPAAGYSQALADWVVAEIQVTGDAVEVAETRFGGGKGRTARLAPRDGVVEIALMNAPQAHSEGHHHAGEPGKHFEMFYELADRRPPNRLRPVPHVGSVPLSNLSIHSIDRDEPHSALLEGLGLDPGRGVYDPVICPVAQFPAE